MSEKCMPTSYLLTESLMKAIHAASMSRPTTIDVLATLHSELNKNNPKCLEPSVVVKDLVWQVFCSNSGNCVAKSPVGEYVIQKEDDLWMVYLPYQDKIWGKGHDTIEAAKDVAQGHYEQKIMSAIA